MASPLLAVWFLKLLSPSKAEVDNTPCLYKSISLILRAIFVYFVLKEKCHHHVVALADENPVQPSAY